MNKHTPVDNVLNRNRTLAISKNTPVNNVLDRNRTLAMHGHN